MILLLNGPLGIGKSTLAEELAIPDDSPGDALGEPFDVPAPIMELAMRLRERVGL